MPEELHERFPGERMEVPGSREEREQLWCEALNQVKELPRHRPLSRDECESAGKHLLRRLSLEERYLGYAMVMVNNAFWFEQYQGVPTGSRLLLLPRCLTGLEEAARRATELGYRVHIAEGSPEIIKIIAEEDMEAILGVGCLESLEKAYRKVSQLGIPSVAVPLTRDGCKETETDGEMLNWFLESRARRSAVGVRNYLPLIRITHKIFGEELESLLSGLATEDGTHRIAIEWMRRGGKRLRPFVTMTGFDALSGRTITDDVKKVALAIEAFHKASLIHDDIEDDDWFRYGEETLHRRYGVGVAINVGDYLVGLGYRLLSEAGGHGELFRIFTRAHILLSRGQGAELLWLEGKEGTLSLEEVLRWYSLKTAPAFEAALASGASLAGAYEEYAGLIARFSRYIGIGYQVQNDIDDWLSDGTRTRPNALMALAFERASEAERGVLLTMPDESEVREIYERRSVFERARLLADRFRHHARVLAEEIENRTLSELFLFLVESLL